MKSRLAPWRVIERRSLVQRTFLKVWEERVQLASGREIDDFCILDAPDWAAVVPVTEAGQVVLVRQYRHGVRGESLELPAGALEPGEAPLDAARRELLEESGYSSERWEPLLVSSLDPARQSGWAHFYAAREARATDAQRLDPSEDIEIVLVSPGELMGLIDSGRIVHGIHIAAILLAQRRGLF